MFGLFSPKCPLDTWEKTWTETRMQWLADKLGIERLLDAEVVVPDDHYFPEPYRGTFGDVRRLLDRLCCYMGVDPLKIDLEECADVQMPGAAGHYERGERTVIRIAATQLADPQGLLATLAHELAHEVLMGGGLLSADVADHEWITDLLPVFLGVGIFAANSTIQEDCGHAGNWSWWKMAKQGYLPSRMFGYALALFAFVRGEEKPEWVRYLRLDASAALREGLRYLLKTGDSLFHPDNIRSVRHRASVGELLDRLQSRTPSLRLAALWEIREHAVADAAVIAAAAHCLEDSDPAIPGAAARALASVGAAAGSALPALLKALWGGGDDARAGAAHALGVLRLQPERVIPELAAMLEEKNRTLVAAASGALRQFGALAEGAVERLLTALAEAFVECEYELITDLCAALRAVAPDAEQRASAFFGERDAELRRRALEALAESMGDELQGVESQLHVRGPDRKHGGAAFRPQRVLRS